MISRKTQFAPERLISASIARATISRGASERLRMITLHEIFAAIVAQDSAFASHRFGNQKRFRFRMKQTGRMKLNELHVRDDRAGAPGHGHAVPGRDIRVGRVKINFPATAGGKHDSIGADRFDLARFFIEHVSAEAAIFRRRNRACPP